MKKQEAVVAAGCFWGVEELFREMKGVIDTQVGYCGGQAETALYTKVKTGQTNHAEAVKIIFDADQLSYADLLRAFFKLHDPTTMNQQGNDIGTQYRSVIFYADADQQATAEKIKAEVDQSGKWQKPIVTAIVPSAPFYNAEDYHQDYLQKNPDGYTCHYWRN